jgi:hypothetical protein
MRYTEGTEQKHRPALSFLAFGISVKEKSVIVIVSDFEVKGTVTQNTFSIP